LRDATKLPLGNWLAVNFSPSAVIDGSAAAVVKGASRDIVVEITEHNQIDNYAAVRHAISGCGDVRIAVDDAGAGFASLRHILELQPDIIKLDIALVRDIDIDPARQALAAGLRHFAALTGTTLVAEGVETMAEANAVRTLGVELAQGYLFSRVHDQAVLPLP
jgi:EAL domain-containing protein (putative c-di-GMP-specific phosphodiesterase class I)